MNHLEQLRDAPATITRQVSGMCGILIVSHGQFFGQSICLEPVTIVKLQPSIQKGGLSPTFVIINEELPL